jgi:hypothetical protein
MIHKIVLKRRTFTNELPSKKIRKFSFCIIFDYCYADIWMTLECIASSYFILLVFITDGELLHY